MGCVCGCCANVGDWGCEYVVVCMFCEMCVGGGGCILCAWWVWVMCRCLRVCSVGGVYDMGVWESGDCGGVSCCVRYV